MLIVMGLIQLVLCLLSIGYAVAKIGAEEIKVYKHIDIIIPLVSSILWIVAISRKLHGLDL